MNSKEKWLPVIGDGVVVIFVIISMILLFVVGFPGAGGSMVATDISALKYFTVESNILIGIISLITLLYRLKTNKPLPLVLLVIKFVIVTSVMVTFLTTMLYLLPTMQDPILVLYADTFLHILTPLVALTVFMLFDNKDNTFKFIHTLYAMLPVGVYGTFYLLNVAIHNGYGTVEYDWYGFGRFGLGIGIVSFLIMIALSWGISLLIFLGYKKINIMSGGKK